MEAEHLKFAQCIADLNMVCTNYTDMPMVEDIWTEVYPDDPMTFNDFGFFLMESADEEYPMFNPDIPDDVENLYHKLTEMGYAALVEKVREYIKIYGG